MANHILADKKIILESNKLDIENSKSKNLSDSFIDRLELNSERVDSISDTLNEIESFKDPVGRILDSLAKTKWIAYIKDINTSWCDWYYL